MSEIKFAADEKAVLVARIQQYFRDELDQSLGQFDAEFLLEFFSDEVGAYFYNQGLLDAQAVSEKQLESIVEAIDELQKPTTFPR